MTTCAGCGKPISGTYTKAMDRSWHDDCFRCAGCGRAIGRVSFHTHEGHAYHEECYHERFSPRCAACGQPIAGQYVTAMEKQWHPEHFACAQCKEPFRGRSFYERDGKPYCETDFHELFSPRCAVCGEPMRGTYLTNAWGDAYCQKHKGEVPDCFSCGRPICQRLTGGGVRFGDGRTMCNRCRKSAIDEARQARPLLVRVQQALAGLGLEMPGGEIPLRLADQAELRRLLQKSYAKQPAGMARTQITTSNGKVVDRKVEEIVLLHGLPAEHAASVIAHELGHVWMFTQNYPELPPLVEEGVCELFEHLWLKSQRTPEAEYRLKVMDDDTSPVYGEGFQAARRALRKRTLAQMLAYVRQHRRFPD